MSVCMCLYVYLLVYVLAASYTSEVRGNRGWFVLPLSSLSQKKMWSTPHVTIWSSSANTQPSTLAWHTRGRTSISSSDQAPFRC
jgi:hypothetical protein